MRRAAPKGVNCYFDNVGGAISQVIGHPNPNPNSDHDENDENEEKTMLMLMMTMLCFHMIVQAVLVNMAMYGRVAVCGAITGLSQSLLP